MLLLWELVANGMIRYWTSSMISLIIPMAMLPQKDGDCTLPQRLGTTSIIGRRYLDNGTLSTNIRLKRDHVMINHVHGILLLRYSFLLLLPHDMGHDILRRLHGTLSSNHIHKKLHKLALLHLLPHKAAAIVPPSQRYHSPAKVILHRRVQSHHTQLLRGSRTRTELQYVLIILPLTQSARHFSVLSMVQCIVLGGQRVKSEGVLLGHEVIRCEVYRECHAIVGDVDRGQIDSRYTSLGRGIFRIQQWILEVAIIHSIIDDGAADVVQHASYRGIHVQRVRQLVRIPPQSLFHPFRLHRHQSTGIVHISRSVQNV
mmetsp:Transcript_39100/g.84313  ORF Transcript_39100/g.84313 Transcript_39100/m.84313 type:complete len:315 (-) Transcript_39100:406-1350(-)